MVDQGTVFFYTSVEGWVHEVRYVLYSTEPSLSLRLHEAVGR